MERGGGAIESDQEQIPMNLWLYQEQVPIYLEVDRWLGKLSITDWAIAAALMEQLSNKRKDVKNVIQQWHVSDWQAEKVWKRSDLRLISN